MIQSDLLPELGGYINGQWQTRETGFEPLHVIDPATGELLAKLPRQTRSQTRTAIDAAAAAMARTPPLEKRQQWLTRIHDDLLANKQEIGRIITLEHGKPLAEAVGEVEYAASFYAFYAGQLHHLQSEPQPEQVRGCRWTIHHRPAGVAALITPWNFPIAMLAKKLSAAIGAGCASIAKPASATPLTAIAQFTLLDRMDFPPGFVNLVIGNAGPIGEALFEHDAVRIVSFTGSTEVGRKLIKQSAPGIKRLSLELGGNAPFIVFEDADLDAAADALIANKFRAGGQTCVCANRVLAHTSIADAFAQKVADRVARLKVGHGIEPGVDVGPLIDRDGFKKVERHLKDALAKGARKIAGGELPWLAEDWGAFFPPTVVTEVNPDMLVCQEETFGPLIAIRTFENEQQAIDIGNETEHGLAAYLFSGDRDRCQRVVVALKFGHVGVNTGTGPAAPTPFGGMKHSGFGREGGIEGLLEFCESQVVAEGA